jgi:hypothetical protein
VIEKKRQKAETPKVENPDGPQISQITQIEKKSQEAKESRLEISSAPQRGGTVCTRSSGGKFGERSRR